MNIKGAFVSVTDSVSGVSKTLIGVIVKDEHDSGVYRGHCDIWFGDFFSQGKPYTHSYLVSKVTFLPSPIAYS
jgi:hypothetical protein